MNDDGPFVMVTEIVDPRIHGELKNLMKDAEFADNQPDIMGVSFFIHVWAVFPIATCSFRIKK